MVFLLRPLFDHRVQPKDFFSKSEIKRTNINLFNQTTSFRILYKNTHLLFYVYNSDTKSYDLLFPDMNKALTSFSLGFSARTGQNASQAMDILNVHFISDKNNTELKPGHSKYRQVEGEENVFALDEIVDRYDSLYKNITLKELETLLGNEQLFAENRLEKILQDLSVILRQERIMIKMIKEIAFNMRETNMTRNPLYLKIQGRLDLLEEMSSNMKAHFFDLSTVLEFASVPSVTKQHTGILDGFMKQLKRIEAKYKNATENDMKILEQMVKVGSQQKIAAKKMAEELENFLKNPVKVSSRKNTLKTSEKAMIAVILVFSWAVIILFRLFEAIREVVFGSRYCASSF